MPPLQGCRPDAQESVGRSQSCLYTVSVRRCAGSFSKGSLTARCTLCDGPALVAIGVSRAHAGTLGFGAFGWETTRFATDEELLLGSGRSASTRTMARWPAGTNPAGGYCASSNPWDGARSQTGEHPAKADTGLWVLPHGLGHWFRMRTEGSGRASTEVGLYRSKLTQSSALAGHGCSRPAWRTAGSGFVLGPAILGRIPGPSRHGRPVRLQVSLPALCLAAL